MPGCGVLKGENNVHQDEPDVLAPLPSDPPEVVVEKELMAYVVELESSDLSPKSIRECLQLYCMKRRRTFEENLRLAAMVTVAFFICFLALVASIFVTEDGQCLFAFVAMLVACLAVSALLNVINWTKRLDALKDFEYQCRPPDN
jgi:hypothetical protein